MTLQKENMKLKLPILLSYLVSLLTPLVLIGLALRILLSPIYYSIEYNMPYFPADEYGFTKADRLQWAPYAVNYLVNGADITYLGDLKFDDGAQVYNDRELSHMADVKKVVKGALKAWYISQAILLALLIWAWRGNFMPEFMNGLRRGGWWMILLALVIGGIAGGGIAVDPNIFWNFFSWFHGLFFTGDSWLFSYSDTLIRLFPIRFWEDALLAAAVIALGSGAALAFGIKPKI